MWIGAGELGVCNHSIDSSERRMILNFGFQSKLSEFSTI
jgi:hypothetical protein